jgi:hypothetical protein
MELGKRVTAHEPSRVTRFTASPISLCLYRLGCVAPFVARRRLGNEYKQQ